MHTSDGRTYVYWPRIDSNRSPPTPSAGLSTVSARGRSKTCWWAWWMMRSSRHKNCGNWRSESAVPKPQKNAKGAPIAGERSWPQVSGSSDCSCDVSLKAILLATAAAIALWLLRVRSTSVRHCVWTAVLTAMLTLPLLVAATPAVPLPNWAYPDLRFGDDQKLLVEETVAASVATKAVPPVAALNLPSLPSLETAIAATATDQPSPPRPQPLNCQRAIGGTEF